MKILALDTSTFTLSLAITEDEKILGQRNTHLGKELSSKLIPAIRDLLKKIRLKLKDIDAIAVGVGPGSFTGLRVGITTVKGISVATGIPIAKASSLDAIALGLLHTGDICVVLDAKKSNVYACIFNKKNGSLKRASKYLLIKPEELLAKIKKPMLFAGDGIKVYKDLISKKLKSSAFFADEKYWLPKAASIAKLALSDIKANKFIDADELAPMYLYHRECNVTKTKKKPLI